MRRYFYFDIDGVLVDSRATVRAAYEGALGQRIDDAVWQEVWGKPWKLWLPDFVGEVGESVGVHRRKNDIYRELIRGGHALPLAGAVAVRLLHGMDHGVRLITGASETAAHAVLHWLNIPIQLLDVTEASRTDKVTRLAYLESHGGVIHTDDDEKLIAELEERRVPAVHFHGQSIDELMDELWTRSS